MGYKSPEVHETQCLTDRDGPAGKRSQTSLMPWLRRSKDSRCSLDSVHKHGWKPLTLSAPVLFSFAFVSVILAVIIEVLAQQSQRDGGLALSPSADDIPTYAKFGYLFLPTIVAVIYSLLWSWIDLDVKRIHPWLEMSKPAGAPADSSIFLEYPYEFIAFVPIKAAKRRHWAVFHAGTIMVIIFWLITPLQSAILGTGPVDVRKMASMSTSMSTLPSLEQSEIMDQSILNEGYSLTWLNQSQPPFTAKEYTLLPFTAESGIAQSSSTNWTGQTTKYWTQLDCWSANISQHGPSTKRTYDFDNGRGCNASDIDVYGSINDIRPFKMLYVGYQSSPWADYWLASPTCPKSAAGHQFLAMWSRFNATLDKIKMAAVFCETNYYKQSVNVTVSSINQTPIENSLVPSGPRERLPEAEFNYTAFEHLLGAGVSSVELDVKREFPFGRLLEHYQQVSDLGLNWPMSPMAGFGIGLENKPPLDAFQNETFMGEAFNATHKMLFSLALRRVLTNTTSVVTQGAVEYKLHGIIVSRLFSAVVEGLLALVGLFTVFLWWHIYKAPSRLTMDPASLGSLISLCKNSTTLLDKFVGKGCMSEEKLKEAFQDQRFKLFCGCQSGSRQMVIKVVDVRDDSSEGRRISLPQPDHALSIGHYLPVKPLALRREVGSAVILFMVAGVVALGYLKAEEKRIRGLIRPTTNFEVLQILENYVPTIFATLLEPFWVLVNRLLCIIQPFKDLWSGRRSADGSINARYTSLPPQLVFWRAARSGHYILTAMCLLALLSNLLAVGLGGLFNEFPVVIESSREFQQTLMPRLNNESVYGNRSNQLFTPHVAPYDVPFYITMNNISQGTPLPPWVTKDYFFQPFMVPPGHDDTSDNYTAKTRGLGTVPSCSAIGPIVSGTRGPTINHTMIRNGEPVSGCLKDYRVSSFDFNNTRHPNVTGPASAEIVVTFLNDYNVSLCNVPLLLGWARTSNMMEKENGEMESTFVVCDPIFTTAMFDVTVDRNGYVLDSVPSSDPSSTLGYPLSTNHTDAISAYLNRLLYKDGMQYHNDTLSQDWLNYLLKIQPNRADLLDPRVFPNATDLVPAVEYVYRQLYVLMLSLNPYLFDAYPDSVAVAGAQRRTEIRIFMNTTALAISIAVLAINVAVAAALYGFSVKHFLPRMPTTIGSILAYVAPSRAVREYDGPESLKSSTFSFGRYVSDDGRAHVGIELDPFVVPVKLSALRRGDTEPRKGLLSRFLRRGKGAGGGDAWL